MHELSPDTNKKTDWYYDEKTHKYSNHLPLEEQLKKDLNDKTILENHNIQCQSLKEKIKKEKMIKEKTEKIIENKNRLRASIMIQRWWRKHLYEPVNGIFYVKTKQNFEKIK